MKGKSAHAIVKETIENRRTRRAIAIFVWQHQIEDDSLVYPIGTRLQRRALGGVWCVEVIGEAEESAGRNCALSRIAPNVERRTRALPNRAGARVERAIVQ